jgi:hypothetical protein
MRSRILKARQELSIMAHDEIQSRTDLATAAVSLQYKLCALEQQRRLRGVFLGRELVQTTIQILGDTQIHSHNFMVPNQYQRSTGPGENTNHWPWWTETKGSLSAFKGRE